MISRTTVSALVISASALVSIALHESYRADAYIPVPGDVWTYGNGSTVKPDGTPVKKGDKITPERALVLLLADADKYASAVRKCAPVPMYQWEFDAYVSLAYNIGSGAFCGSSIPKKLRAGDYAAACTTILEFSCGPTSAEDKKKAKKGEKCFKDDGKPRKVLSGLTKRRQTEYQLCMTDPDAAPANDPGRVAASGSGL